MKSNHDKIRMLLVDNSALNMEYKNGPNRFCHIYLEKHTLTNLKKEKYL